MKRHAPITEYRQLLDKQSDTVIYRCVAGSRAYGTAGPVSDVDTRGIYVLPTAAYLTLDSPAEQLADERNNEVYYALRRFLELAATANPNIIELLFMPEECVTLQTDCMDRVLSARNLFVTRRAYDSHVAYAVAQIKKARGQNKWVNNPKPEAPPAKEDFCWIVPREGTQWSWPEPPYRPVPVAESEIDLAECHAAALEHTPGVYRLYHYGPPARGVFRGGNLVCESIPLADEVARCVGLMIFNEPAYNRSVKDHHNYWKWRRERNDARWLTQEQGQIDYDAKNLMHSFRLLLSAEHIFREGEPRVRFGGEELQFLLAIRAGDYAYDSLIAMAEEKVILLTELRDRSALPDAPDLHAIGNLLAEITDLWESHHARENR
jgi:uncharacterized protein